CRQYSTKENATTTVSSLDMSSITSFLKDTSFYSYSGSLTTPPCIESVLWLVATKHQTISQGQHDKFKRYAFNARTTQPNKSQNKNETDHAPEKNATDAGTHGETSSKASSDNHYATKTESKHSTPRAAVYQYSTVKSILQSSATKASVAVTAVSLLLTFYLF
ncbi:UNVERIFIED_CONTAM: hypothetical protein HDU68_001367, partial [Siphonaria sp. JEL0065]